MFAEQDGSCRYRERWQGHQPAGACACERARSVVIAETFDRAAIPQESVLVRDSRFEHLRKLTRQEVNVCNESAAPRTVDRISVNSDSFIKVRKHVAAAEKHLRKTATTWAAVSHP